MNVGFVRLAILETVDLLLPSLLPFLRSPFPLFGTYNLDESCFSETFSFRDKISAFPKEPITEMLTLASSKLLSDVLSFSLL